MEWNGFLLKTLLAFLLAAVDRSSSEWHSSEGRQAQLLSVQFDRTQFEEANFVDGIDQTLSKYTAQLLLHC